MTCDQNRVLFRSVPSFRTSIECSACGHTEQRNRLSRDRFLCRRCGCADDADINAARVILRRFLTGAYGPGCKAKVIEIYDGGNGACPSLEAVWGMCRVQAGT